MRNLFLLAVFCVFNVGIHAQDIDFNHARELMQRKRAGQTLTADEEEFLQHAQQEYRKRQTAAATGGKATIGVKPLSEMTATDNYKGEDGGLYGGGRNDPAEPLRSAAQRAAAKIQPLDAQGNPAADGKIVLISIGMSNTTQEFSKFVALANADTEKSPKMLIVDGAQGGQDAAAWADKPAPWQMLDQRLDAAGATAAQVQIAWLKQALIQPARLGEFPKHAEKLKADNATIIADAKKRFPNLRIVYFSSRIYAGYATTQLNPEPYAFESAFAVRWLIRDQKSGEPVLLWGPYLWGDGTTARKADGLTWLRADLREDGTHPSESGRQKVAELLLNFFKADPLARTWFVKH